MAEVGGDQARVAGLLAQPGRGAVSERVRGDVLMLQSLLWDDEVREAKFPSLGANIRVSPAELKMSEQLVDSYATNFSPDKFSDDYQDELRQLIEAMAGRPRRAVPEKPPRAA